MGAWIHPARLTAAALVASVALLWLPPAALAAGRTSGLADVERVLRDAAAATDADAAPRRYATLLVLTSAARRITTLEGARPLPDDTALVAGYSRAMQQLTREAAAGQPGCAGDQCPAQQLMRRALELARSPGYAQGVLQKFSTPEWQQTNMAALFARTGGAAAEAGPAGGAVQGASPTAVPPSLAAQAPAAPATALPATAAAPAAPAAGPLPPGFEFLGKMPAVERVLGEVSGADAVDTKVQQQATFYFLAMDVLLTMRGGAPQVPSQFTALDRAYKSEVTRLDRELRSELAPGALPRVLLQVMNHQGNVAFKQQSLQRFFDAAFVASYEQKKSEFANWRAQANSRPTGAATVAGPGVSPAGSGGAGSVAAAGTPGTAAPAAAPAAPAAPRVLRSPSGVDMMAFGLPLGEALRLPACDRPAGGAAAAGAALASLAGMGEGPKTTCQAQGGPAALLVGENGVSIRLQRSHCPGWINSAFDCSVIGMLHGGRLDGVMVVTGGLDAQEQIVKDLREKYGKPSRGQKRTWSNATGGRWEVEELTWDLKDLVVEYRPMGKSTEGGTIWVVTAAGRRFIDAESARQDARRPRM
ncbi:MAG: hypothetical protein JNJ89_18555 [Rubrivivax sp.]|nr:hypothetical protein [Rubrivivax sp.]